jgi:hypothetical protein
VKKLSDVQISKDAQDARFDPVIRKFLRRAVNLSQLSPALIADELTKRLGRPVRESMIYAWMASTNANRLPVDVLPHICEILEDDSIQRLVLGDKLRQALELGESTSRVVSLLRKALEEPRSGSKR